MELALRLQTLTSFSNSEYVINYDNKICTIKNLNGQYLNFEIINPSNDHYKIYFSNYENLILYYENYYLYTIVIDNINNNNNNIRYYLIVTRNGEIKFTRTSMQTYFIYYDNNNIIFKILQKNFLSDEKIKFTFDYINTTFYFICNGTHTIFTIAAKYGHIDIVEYYLNLGLDIDYQDEHGDTALISAVKGQHIDLVRFLLYKSANINIKNNLKHTALICALCQNNLEIYQLLKIN